MTLFLIIIGALLLTHVFCKTREYFTDSGSNSDALITLDPKNYIIKGKGIHAHKGKLPVTKIKTEDDKYVFLAQDGENTIVVKSTDVKGDSDAYYYKGNVSEYGTIDLISNGKDFNVEYLKVNDLSNTNTKNTNSSFSDTNTSTSADLSNDVNAYNPLDQTNTSNTSNMHSNTNLRQMNQDTYVNYSSHKRGIPRSMIPPGDEDLYILKSEIVPPVCPKCPDVSVCPKNDTSKCPPCPACARCPEPSFECKKVPNYKRRDDTYLPKPILSDFSQFGM
tara:strand:- start:524 stop:1354 length:831 start_codon:yes stop_codon:yes gene_type:complete